MNTSDLKSFHYLENGEVSFSVLDTVKTNKKLDSGSYKVNWLPYPENKVQLKMNTDTESAKIHNFPDKQKLDELFQSFFDPKVKKKVSNLEFHHKTGVLLYGKEGTGKSTIIKHYCHRAVKDMDAIVFYMVYAGTEIRNCWELVTNVRRIQSNPIIVVFEEFDEQISEKNEAYLKTVLDGNLSIDNCIFFASTNYIENIPAAMKDRPSRFKYSLKIEGVHYKNDVYNIVHNTIGDMFSESEISSFANELKGQTLDHIKNFCLDKIMDIKSYQKKRSVIGFLQNAQ